MRLHLVPPVRRSAVAVSSSSARLQWFFDVLVVLSGYLIAAFIVHQVFGGVLRLSLFDATHVTMLTAFLLLLSDRYGLYESNESWSESAWRVAAVFGGTTVLFGGLLYNVDSSRALSSIVLASAPLTITGAMAWRSMVCRRAQRKAARGDVRNVLIVGAGKLGRTLASYIDERARLEYTVCGFLDEQKTQDVMGTLDDFVATCRANFIDEVFVTTPIAGEKLRKLTEQARECRVNIQVVPDVYSVTDELNLHTLGTFAVLSLHRESIPATALLVKRAVDIVGAAIGLILLSPLFAVVALCVRLDSAGPVFYAGERVGKKARRFRCYKFRTMVANAEELKQVVQHLNKRDAVTFKVSNDPRVTRIGHFLRKSSIDELPQLWNVLKGDMSLVGPRPHPVDDYRHYCTDHLRRLTVLPGITGLWQVTARKDSSFARNLLLDLEYIDNWSPWLDLKILFKTIPAVLRGEGE